MNLWLIETLLATTLLMALVMMLRRPVARWLGAGAAYWLWALPVARMLLPSIPHEVAAPSPLHEAVDQAGLPDLVVMLPTAPSGPAPFPWLELGVTVWLAGILLFLSFHAIAYIRFRRLILRDAVLLGEEGRLRIVASPRASGPLAFGVLHPHIVLPTDFDARFDPLEREMALAHERAHHDHNDLAANLAALALLGIHWCNPVAWIAYRAFRADQEQACDARVLSLYGQDNAQTYGRAILKAAGARPFAGACHLSRITALKGRLKMLSNHELSLRRISWGMAAVGALTLSGLMLTASGSRAAQKMAAAMPEVRLSRLSELVVQDASASTETSLMHRTDADQTPLPPVPPVPPVDDVDPVAPVPPVPPVRAMDAAKLEEPIPPVPPVPPVVQRRKFTFVRPDGRKEVHEFPSEAEIRRMVPDIDIAEGCEGGSNVSRQETVDKDGRRHVRMRICKTRIERDARNAERDARVAERGAQLAEADAARAERDAHKAALAGLMRARESIARNADLSGKVRADVLRELDGEIADMRSERN
jgi:bla regulator protein BlaR1